MSIAGNIVDWLSQQPEPRTMAEIREAVLPGASAAAMHNHIGPLVKAGRVRRVARGAGRAAGSTFEATGKPDGRRKPMTVRRPVTVLQKPSHAPVNVAADVAAFLRAGGRIQKLPRGAVSQPFKRIEAQA